MSKKKRNKRKSKRYTSIAAHKRIKKELHPPMATLPRMNEMSWLNDGIPEMLWAILVVSCLDESDFITIFRNVATCGERFRDQEDIKVSITHSGLSLIDKVCFFDIVNCIVSHPSGRATLRPLLLLDQLPGYERWRDILDEDPRDEDWNVLGEAVGKVLFHQTEEATHCRWAKLVFRMASGGVFFHQDMEETAKEIAQYPDYGDLRKVRPSIRAMELMFRTEEDTSLEWCDEFWKACLQNTLCFVAEDSSTIAPAGIGTTRERVEEVWNSLHNHFRATLENTSTDARHDASFGFCFYSLALLEELLQVGNNQGILARHSLRSLVEVYITFSFLLKKDKEKLWKSYRTYGSGQAKLAFLKLEELSGELPTFVSKDGLELMANEDIHQEFLSIDLGHWASLDLRKMAEESDTKEIYDKYYSWTSSFIHGHWSSIRDATFRTCLNPLHRLHRIPRETTRTLEDAVPDACVLVDLMLEHLDHAYPSFDKRVAVEGD